MNYITIIEFPFLIVKFYTIKLAITDIVTSIIILIKLLIVVIIYFIVKSLVTALITIHKFIKSIVTVAVAELR